MKKRATVVISGDVQDVGYRATVMRLAQKSGLVGYVENLPDGTVRAVCEGEEDSIKGFIKKLHIRADDIAVEKIDVKWSKALGRFKYFEVKIIDLGNEMFQGFNTAGRMLGEVKSEIKSMHSDVNLRFDTLDDKYGKISNQVNVLTSELQKSTAALVAMTEKVGAIIDRKLAE